MDVTNVTGKGVVPGQNALPKRAEAPAVPQVPKQEVKVSLPQPTQQVEAKPAVSDVDRARAERVRAAAEAIKNLYAVSDTRFTIFKDTAGDYVTRFTSLRDGSVQYYPEKTMFELAQARKAAAFDAQV